MGTFGTGPFDNDGALDLLDELASQPADRRRGLLERLLFGVQDRPDLLGWKFFPDEVVAAAAGGGGAPPPGGGGPPGVCRQLCPPRAVPASAPDPRRHAPPLSGL